MLSRLHLPLDLRQHRLQSLTISISLLHTNETIQWARPGRRGHSRGESEVVFVELQDLVYLFQAHVGLYGDGFLPDDRPPLLSQFWRVSESHSRIAARGVWRDLTEDELEDREVRFQGGDSCLEHLQLLVVSGWV